MLMNYLLKKQYVISLLYTVKKLMTVLFLYSHFCFMYTVCACWTLSFFLPSHTLRLQNFFPVHKLTAFNSIFLL